MKHRILFLLLLLVWLPACSTFREVPVTRMGKDIHRGNLVRVTDHDDLRTMFYVTAVDEGVVMGEDVRFRAADIKMIEKEGNYALQGAGGLVQLLIACAMVAGAVAAI